jgi:hypothetical protein
MQITVVTAKPTVSVGRSERSQKATAPVRAAASRRCAAEAERLDLDVVYDTPSLVVLRVPHLAQGLAASLPAA